MKITNDTQFVPKYTEQELDYLYSQGYIKDELNYLELSHYTQQELIHLSLRGCAKQELDYLNLKHILTIKYGQPEKTKDKERGPLLTYNGITLIPKELAVEFENKAVSQMCSEKITLLVRKLRSLN